MPNLNEINQYFKDLLHNDLKSYNKRAGSFERIIDAIEEGDELTLRHVIKTSIATFGSGFSKRYAKRLVGLELILDKDGIESLQNELTTIDLIFHNIPSSEDKDEVPLINLNNNEDKDDNEFPPPSLHQQNFINHLICSIITNLQVYQTRKVGEFKHAKQQIETDPRADSLLGLGLEIVKTKAKQRFFKSGIKIDLNLTGKKIDLAKSLISNLCEILEDRSDTPSERIAATAAFFLLDTLKQNEDLTKKSYFGSKGTFDKIIKDALKYIEKYYPEGMQITFKHLSQPSVLGVMMDVSRNTNL